MRFWQYHKDRALLRDCDSREKKAVEKFNNLSYMNTIRATIRRVTEGHIDDPDTIESLAVLSAAEIYARYVGLPRFRGRVVSCVRHHRLTLELHG
jgi:hypothetical protein